MYHNFVKVKCFTYLSTCEGLETSADISQACNLNIKSLHVLLQRWTGWGYVKRVPGYDDFGKLRYLYWLAPKGWGYLESLNKWYPHLDEARLEVLLSTQGNAEGMMP